MPESERKYDIFHKFLELCPKAGQVSLELTPLSRRTRPYKAFGQKI